MSGKSIQPGPFQGTWSSLRTYQCPDWFRDAKLGIWAHWGPQCVPQCGDWYARHMYIEGHDQYLHHRRTYGHPSRSGYKDLVTLWKAERFDPDALMDLYVRAGAKYFMAQAVHHDNFDNWDSRHHRWNAVRTGPKKNIVKLWEEAARRRGLPFGLSEHLAASFTWSCPNKGADRTGPFAGVPYDGNDPGSEDLYLPNRGASVLNEQNFWEVKPWLTTDTGWHDRWFERIKDLVDQHHPDLLYSDSELPFEGTGLDLVAHLYNTSVAQHGTNRAVYTQKGVKPEIYTIGVLDVERGGLLDIDPRPWQTDTCVGGWFYDVRARYKTPDGVIRMLVDIVSKNGNLMLNLPQRPDGTLDEECLYILKCLEGWIVPNGEGIYGTRPWSAAGEGPTKGEGGAFKEKELTWTREDFRFTSKPGIVYAFQMVQPEDGKALIRSLGSGSGFKVRQAALLGSDAPLKFSQSDQGLSLSCGERVEPPVGPVRCYRVDLG